MAIVICPGFHPPQLTIDFLKGLGRDASSQVIIYPAERLPPYSSLHLLTFLQQQIAAQTPDKSKQKPPLLFIGFSAGVVAAVGAAQAWQATGGSVKALIAIDGWGVPLGGMPIHRISHDAFTHWSSALLGGDGEGFYADPSVSHLDLWRSPHQVRGYCVSSALRHLSAFSEPAIFSDQITAAALLNHWLDRYGEVRIT